MSSVERVVARIDAVDLARVSELADVLREDSAEATGLADADDREGGGMEQRCEVLTVMALGVGVHGCAWVRC